jgi:hypothetical protein
MATVLERVTKSCRPTPEDGGRNRDSSRPGRTRMTSRTTAWAAWYLRKREKASLRTMPRYRPKKTAREAKGTEK